MKIWLLTHQRESLKKTNTGQLVQQTLADECETLIWQRKQPDARLLTLIEQQSIALLYPAKEDEPATSTIDIAIDNFIIIDSTWQQAQKMLNQSPYLQATPRLSLSFDQPSSYRLRRNQKENGLCTAEVAIALLHSQQQDTIAQHLQSRFDNFNQT